MSNVPVPKPGLIALGVVAALALGIVPATAAISEDSAGSAPTVAQRSSNGGGTHTVTLITGDKVTIGTASDGTVVRSFQGANGTTTGFHRAVIDGATYVYPDAALPYVGAGRLDKQLFNVTRLIADGYDDAHASKLPLIVSYTDTAAKSRTFPKVAGSSDVRRLDSIQGAALAQNRKEAPVFWSALTGGSGVAARSASQGVFANGVAKVWLDGKVKVDLAESTAQVSAQKVWAEGNTGKGVKVAVLDTGVDAEHPDLAGQIDDSVSFVPGPDEGILPTTRVMELTLPRRSPVLAAPPTARSGVSLPASVWTSARSSTARAAARSPGSSQAWNGLPGTSRPGLSV